MGEFLFFLFVLFVLSCIRSDEYHCHCRRNSGCLVPLAWLLGFAALSGVLHAFS
jgi:hypothetical protein